MSDQARIGEAIASLTTRLDAWGVDEPNEKAHAFVHDMLRNGWRARALPVQVPSYRPGAAPARPEVLDTLRTKLAEAKSVLCSHGVSRRNCLQSHDDPADQEAPA